MRARQTGMRLLRVLGLVFLVSACGQSGGHEGLLGQATPTPTPTTATPTTTASPAPRPGVVAGSAVAATGTPMTPGSPAPSRPPATITPTASTVVVRDGDGGSTVRLRVGQRLEVRLADVSWTPPTSSATKVVVRRSSSGGYPSGRPVVAVFEALTRGAADVTSWTDAACFHTMPRCLMPTREWVLHVTVT